MEQAPRTPSAAGRVDARGPRNSPAPRRLALLRKSPAARRRALLVALLLVLSRTDAAGGAEYTFSWSHPRPQGNALNGAAFEDASTGYAVGDRGAVLRTTDGGASWALVDLFPEFSADLEDLVVLGPGDLLAVGAAPGIFRSTDAGATWTAVTNPSTARLMDVEIVAGATLCAVGDSGQVLRSTNGGATWTMLPSPGGDLREQLWLDASNGFVLGVFLARRTTDGGQTWSSLSGVSETELFSEAFFTDAQHGFILSDFMIWRSTNGGATWTGAQPPGSIVNMGNTVVLGPEHFLVVSNHEGAFVYETTDAGASWSFAFDSGAGGFHDFDRLADGTLLTVSSEGDIFSSTDDGATWVNAIEAAGPPRYTIGAVGVSPSGKGAAGSTGTPGLQWYHTDDGGAHWAIQPSGPSVPFTAEIAWWDANTGIAAGDYGKMWRTTDGGETWVSAAFPNPPFNAQARHISLPAAGIAFAAVAGQSESRVYRTTDFGASWVERSSGIASGLTSVSFVTPQSGFACGVAGSQARLYKTTDGGGSWTPVGTTGLTTWPWDMHWHDSQTGIVTAYAGSDGIFRTTNGGASWASVWPSGARELSFSDPLHGGAAVDHFGEVGMIYVTEDGGATWESLSLPATEAGTTLTATPDGFLVGGAAGTIVRATRVVPVGVGGAGDAGSDGPGVPAGVKPERCVLLARTPVGSRVELDFALAAPGHAELAVFDLTGRRVAVLARGDFPGEVTMRAEWDGARDAGGRAAAGVYFARLVSAGEARAVKVTLLR